MPRVICTLDNASDEISGVKFHPLEDGGKVSDEISDEQAELFLGIPGYEPFDGEVDEPKPVAPPPTTRKKTPAQAPAKQPAQTETPVAPAAATAAQGESKGDEEVF